MTNVTLERMIKCQLEAYVTTVSSISRLPKRQILHDLIVNISKETKSEYFSNCNDDRYFTFNVGNIKYVTVYEDHEGKLLVVIDKVLLPVEEKTISLMFEVLALNMSSSIVALHTNTLKKLARSAVNDILNKR